MPTILCIATYFKGDAFLRECHRLGATVVLLTSDTLRDAAWPREAVAELHTVPRRASDDDIRRVVAAVARRQPIARIAALDDFDVEMAGMLREFLQLPGFGRTVASRFRDKLAMRTSARQLGLMVPAFTGVFNDAAINEWAARVPPPWVLKPRSSAAATGIRKISAFDQLWPALHAAGDDRPACLLEAFVAGEVWHADSIVRNGEVVFAVPSKYGRPPMQIAHQGGIFVTRRMREDSPDAAAVLDANLRLLTGLGLQNGVSHTEFIVNDGGVTFLETSARVGGAHIVDVVEAGTGVNLWREWAKVELDGDAGAYDVPVAANDAAGIALCLSRQEHPDLSGYTDPEIVMKIPKAHHAGVIVRSADYDRIETLLDAYASRFSHDFLATMPAPDRPVE